MNAADDTPNRAELCALADYIETLIGHEIELFGQRLAGLLTAQGFLFATFAGVVTSDTTRTLPVGSFVMYVFPMLGLALVGASGLALSAARTCARELCDKREELREKLSSGFGLTLPSLGRYRTGPLRNTTWMGNFASDATLAAVALIWLTAWTLILGTPAIHSGEPEKTVCCTKRQCLDGRDGQNGRDGRDGQNGRDGRDGQNGRDGRDCSRVALPPPATHRLPEHKCHGCPTPPCPCEHLHPDAGP